MPDRPVSFPTPEQERKAITAVCALGTLTLVGAAAFVVAAGLVLVKLAGWVFS